VEYNVRKLCLVSAALAALLAAPAMAADMAVKAQPAGINSGYNWSGWYVGLNGGGAWDNSSGHLDAFTPDFGLAVATGAVPANLGAKHEGGFGGAQVGYNWQRDLWVFGLEADFQGADIGRTNTILFPGIPGVVVPTATTARDHIDWFGTARGRIGIATGNVLFYGTGGLAYGDVNSSVRVVGTPPTTGNFAGSVTDTRFGWAAGAGVEWGFAPNWTVKGEYLHIDLGSSNVTAIDAVQFPRSNLTYRFHHELDTVRVGVNYKFGAPVVARY
jgi:outer membrane immunogenic protein